MEAPTLAEMGDLCPPASSSPEGETVCAALARYENTLRDAIREIHVDVSAFKLGMEQRLEEADNLNGPLGRAVAQLQQENHQLRGQLEALTRQVELLTGMMCERGALLNNNNNHDQKTHYDDIQVNHLDAGEQVHGKIQNQVNLHIQTQGGQAQTHSGQPSPSTPPATFSSSPGPGSPTAAGRVSSVAAGPVSSGSPSTTRFSSRATFAVSSKTNVSKLETTHRRLIRCCPQEPQEFVCNCMTVYSIL
ncbi:smoothelin, like [Diretmus argenteus]